MKLPRSIRIATACAIIVTGLGVAMSPVGAVQRAAPGLSKSEHAALVKAGAFGPRPIKVLFLGDSITLTLGVGLTSTSKAEYGITISNHATLGCDLDADLAIETSNKLGPATQGCALWRALWPFLTAYEHPQVVVLGLGRWETSYHYFEGHWVDIADPAWEAHVASDLDAAIKIFTTFGAKVVLLNMPYLNSSQRNPDGTPFLENTPPLTDDFNRVEAQVAAADPTQVTVIPLNAMLDPTGLYQDTVHGVVTRWPDGVHISPAGGRYLEPKILPIIDHVGLSVLHQSRKKE
ncbi:MAG TPA: SGNH hydrolase domain-containing protein [Acidimicrobiales bacterium]